MKKTFYILFCILLAGTMLLGACAANESKETATPGRASDISDTFVVVTVNDQPIYYSQFYPRFSSACSEYGISEDDATYSESIKSYILEMLVEEEIMRQALTEKGYMDFTDTQIAKANTDAQEEIDALLEMYYADSVAMELGDDYTEEQYAQALSKYEEELLSGFGLTKEELVGYYKQQIAEDAAMDDLLGDIAPTDAQIKEQYNENVAYDQESMDEDASVYESALNSGRTIYYTPEGVREVRQILFVFDDETKEAISLLRGQDYNTAADLLRDEALKSLDESANNALKDLDAGMSFEDAMKKYNDPEKEPGNTYTVAEGFVGWVESFTTAAMSLEKQGDYTKLVASDYGYHILQYVDDVTPGPADFESVKDEIDEEMTANLKNEKWQGIVDEWITLAVVVYTDKEY